MRLSLNFAYLLAFFVVCFSRRKICSVFCVGVLDLNTATAFVIAAEVVEG